MRTELQKIRESVPVLWSDERLTLLRVLWIDGLSAEQIAQTINAETEGTFTRNSIIGRVHRLKLNRRRRSPVGRKQRTTPPTKPPLA